MSSEEEAPWGELRCVVGQLSHDDSSSQRIECRGQELVIGRAKDCSLRITSSRLISSRHCRLRMLSERNEVVLEDLSTNGTLLNGVRLAKQQSVPVKHGDRISLVQKKDNPEENLALEFHRIPEGDEGIEESTLEMTIEEVDAQDVGFAVGATKRDPELRDDDELPAKRTPSDQPGASASVAPSNSDTMMQTLLCGICQDILHDCVSLQPCMHAFCAGCYCPWMARSTACPQCRKRVSAVSKNHIVNNLVECFLSQHPDRRRAADDLAELDAKNTIKEETVAVARKRRRHRAGTVSDEEDDESFDDDDDYDDDDNDDEDEYDDDGSDDDGVVNDNPIFGGLGFPSIPVPGFNPLPAALHFGGPLPPPPQLLCRQCSGYVGAHKLTIPVPPVAAGTNKSVMISDRGDETASDSATDEDKEVASVAVLPPPDAAGLSSTKSPDSPSSTLPSSTTDSTLSSSNVPTSSATASAASRNPIPAPPPFQCPPFPVHLLCACCQQPMPDRRTAATLDPQRRIPTQQCELCHQFYCHLYWGCHGHGCRGCLRRFCDMDFGDAQLVSLVNNNTFESGVLQDHLREQGHGIDGLLAECVAKMRAGDYSTPDSVTSRLQPETVVCYRCGLRNLRELAYLYRRDIPADQLPAAIRSRRDCYWGRNCRTQHNRPHHASNFNHICVQTRF